MRVGSDSGERLVENLSSGLSKTRNTHAGVDHEITIPSLHMPDITLHDANDMRLPEPRNPVREVFVIKPPSGYLKTHCTPLRKIATPLLWRAIALGSSLPRPMLGQHAGQSARGWGTAGFSLRSAPFRH